MFEDWFPLKRSQGRLCAYDFLTNAGYGQESNRIWRSPFKETKRRRAMVVKIIRQEGLEDEFFSTVWPDGTEKHRMKRMDKFEAHYDGDPDLQRFLGR